jgi:hypothetical protein
MRRGATSWGAVSKILLFLKKKKQKDFFLLVARAPNGRRKPMGREHRPRSA